MSSIIRVSAGRSGWVMPQYRRGAALGNRRAPKGPKGGGFSSRIGKSAISRGFSRSAHRVARNLCHRGRGTPPAARSGARNPRPADTLAAARAFPFWPRSRGAGSGKAGARHDIRKARRARGKGRPMTSPVTRTAPAASLPGANRRGDPMPPETAAAQRAGPRTGIAAPPWHGRPGPPPRARASADRKAPCGQSRSCRHPPWR